jgi:hypothetical protein
VNELPWNLRPLQFDHEAAFEADRALDELIRIHDAADHRSGVAQRILGPAEGPFADHLRRQVEGAGTNAAEVVGALRWLQASIGDAREAALVEDVRRQLAVEQWQAERAFTAAVEARAARSLARTAASSASLSVAALPD